MYITEINILYIHTIYRISLVYIYLYIYIRRKEGRDEAGQSIISSNVAYTQNKQL
jgi:hypothetical protein